MSFDFSDSEKRAIDIIEKLRRDPRDEFLLARLIENHAEYRRELDAAEFRVMHTRAPEGDKYAILQRWGDKYTFNSEFLHDTPETLIDTMRRIDKLWEIDFARSPDENSKKYKPILVRLKIDPVDIFENPSPP